MKKQVVLSLSLFSLCLGACGSEDAQPASVTYWQDVAPIYTDKCVGCHQQGGIGPFRLDDYADAKSHAALELARVTEGTMPPYFMVHDGSCQSFHDETTLTAAQKSTIADWVKAGAPEGAPVALVLPERPALADAVELKTPSFSPAAVGDPLAMFDEYRCFALDAPIASEAFLTGYDVMPGEPSIVHHLLAFVVDPDKAGDGGMTNGAVMQALHEQSPDRLGWPCFGAAGDGVTVDAVPVSWAPGQGVVNYPSGMGLPVKPRDKIVIQIHYNLAEPGSDGKTDSSTLRLRFADKVSRELAFSLPDAFLETLWKKDGEGNAAPATLPPHEANTKYTWTKLGREIGIAGIPSADLVAVMPHMHGRGVRQQLMIGSESNMACAAHLEAWNFHWQEFYFYRAPISIAPDTRIDLTCEYDTRSDSEPVLPGWGTRNEMCLAVMMLALPAR